MPALSTSKPLARKAAPATASPESTVVLKKVKVEGGGSRNRPRVSDFDTLKKSLTEEAISIFRAHIGALNPWPARADNWETVSVAWMEVCSSRKLRMEMDEEVLTAVRCRLPLSFGRLTPRL